MRDHLPRRDVRELTAIFLGGAFGGLARVALAEAFPHAATVWPWTTFAVNLLGAFVLGWAVARLPASGYRRPFLGVGVCGALTTFSTFQLELLRMLDGGESALALAYAAASLAAGLALARLGLGVGGLRGSERTA